MQFSPRKQKRLLDVCRKCLSQLPELSGSSAVNSTPTDQPQKKPEQMYSVCDAVHLAVVDVTSEAG